MERLFIQLCKPMRQLLLISKYFQLTKVTIVSPVNLVFEINMIPYKELMKFF
jgi:hypothetical protein